MMFDSKFKVLLVLAFAIGLMWIWDHCSLCKELEKLISNRSMNADSSFIHHRSNFEINLPAFSVPINPEGVSLQQTRAEFVAQYHILVCWQCWREAGLSKNTYLAYAATTLGALDCQSLEEFKENHLLVSENIRIGFLPNDQKSFEQFIALALER